MFNNVDDIRKTMYEFRTKHGKYPNVIFISKEKRREFLEMFHNSFTIDVYSPVRDFFGDITICGVKVRWTENVDGVDWIEEFNEKIQQQYQPLIKSKPIKTISNKRKIIL